MHTTPKTFIDYTIVTIIIDNAITQSALSLQCDFNSNHASYIMKSRRFKTTRQAKSIITNNPTIQCALNFHRVLSIYNPFVFCLVTDILFAF